MKGQVGVDISASAVRVAVVKEIDERGFAVVSRIGIVPLREGMVVNGRVRNPVVVAQALLQALKEAGAPRYGFVLGYAAPDVAATRVALPSAVKANERVTTLLTLDRQISPTLPLADSVIHTNLVRTDVTAEGQSIDSLIVVAALREEVDALRKLMVLAKCQPRAIDLSASALMRALVRTQADNAEVHTVIDIGATKTTVATRQGTHLRSVRVLTIGGTNISRAIMISTGDTPEQAEKRKMVMRLSTATEEMPVRLPSPYGTVAESSAGSMDNESKLDEAVNLVVNDLAEQIAASIENDASNYGNSLTQGIVLSGLTAQMPGLKERISQRLGVPVQLGRPWARIEPTKANAKYLVGGPDNPRPLLELSTAIGLALWREVQ